MIPKKIHYCWLSDDEIPENLKRYIESWKIHLPDYELVLWDKKKFDINTVPWVKEAYESKKYAFAADYIRCHALYYEGGIYMDSDVEVLKSFDDLLNLTYFIGKENDGELEAATMGAIPSLTFFKKSLEYYKGKHFDPKDKACLTPLPLILKNIADSNFGIKYINGIKEFDFSSQMLQVLPFDFFSPKSLMTKIIEKSDRTYSIHHFAGSWLTGIHKFKRNLRKLVGNKTMNMAIRLKRFFISK